MSGPASLGEAYAPHGHVHQFFVTVMRTGLAWHGMAWGSSSSSKSPNRRSTLLPAGEVATPPKPCNQCYLPAFANGALLTFARSPLVLSAFPAVKSPPRAALPQAP